MCQRLRGPSVPGGLVCQKLRGPSVPGGLVCQRLRGPCVFLSGGLVCLSHENNCRILAKIFLVFAVIKNTGWVAWLVGYTHASQAL